MIAKFQKKKKKLNTKKVQMNLKLEYLMKKN